MKAKIFNGDHPITSLYGMRAGKWHNGLDIGMPTGTRLLALKDGKILKNGVDKFGGLYTWVRHNDGSGAIYRHLSAYALSLGTVFNAGQVVGISGNTGKSTGPHLHFTYLENANDESTNRDPLNYIKISNSINTLNMANSEFITVQKNWGLSRVAQAAGLPAIDSTYETIYSLNAGLRGATDWRSLNSRMGAGDALKVRSASVVTPIVAPILIDPKYQEQIADLQAKLAKEVASNQAEITKLELEKTLKEKQVVELQVKNAELNLYAEMYNLKLNNAQELSLVILEETVQIDGVLNTYGHFVDKYIKSETLQNIFKYDVFVWVGQALTGVLAIGIAPFANQTFGWQVNDTAAFLIGLVVGSILKAITLRYDKDKDGRLTAQDYIVIHK